MIPRSEKTSREVWNQRVLRIAHEVASWSKDPKRKVGAVIVSQDFRGFSLGYNGFPRGIHDLDERLQDNDLRKRLTIHAERNAMDNARFGLRNCAIYSTKYPCHDCAKSIIQCGLTNIIVPPPDFNHPSWGSSYELAQSLFQEAGIQIYIRELGDEISHGD
jgi:dCMP deaminase